jgi:hypothetical protein
MGYGVIEDNTLGKASERRLGHKDG